jgi:hypothetical protein
MLSPGGGAGNRAAAMQQVKTLMPGLLHASLAFDSGSKEQQAILRAISALNPLFGKAEATNMVPAGLASLARANAQGPMSAAPPPGVAGAGGGTPPAPPPGMEGAA